MSPIDDIRQPTSEDESRFKVGKDSVGRPLKEEYASIYSELDKTGKVLVEFSGNSSFEEAGRVSDSLRITLKRRGKLPSFGRTRIDDGNTVLMISTVQKSKI